MVVIAGVFGVAHEMQAGRPLRRYRCKDIGDVWKIGRLPLRIDDLMLILEAGQQRVSNRTGAELPDRLELIVDAAIGIVLRPQLAPNQRVTDDMRTRGTHAVVIALSVDVAMRVGEPVVDGQE